MWKINLIYLFLNFTFLSGNIHFDLKLGEVLTYNYQTSLRKCGNDNPIIPITLDAHVKITLLWEMVDKSYYQTSVNKLYLLQIHNVSFSPEIYDGKSNFNFDLPLYFHSYDNQISPLFINNMESPFELQIKKGILSLFQFTNHNMTERDTQHDCEVNYVYKTGYKIRKNKFCHHPAFSVFSQDRSLIKSQDMYTTTRTLYDFNPLDKTHFLFKNNDPLSYFSSARSQSRTTLTSFLSPYPKIFNCSVNQKLTLVKVERLTRQEIIEGASNLNEALLQIDPKYSVKMNSQTLKFNPNHDLTLHVKQNAEIKDFQDEFLHHFQVLAKYLSTNHLSFDAQHQKIHLIKLLRQGYKLQENDDSEQSQISKIFHKVLDQWPQTLRVMIEITLSAQTSSTLKFASQYLLQLCQPSKMEIKNNNINNDIFNYTTKVQNEMIDKPNFDEYLRQQLKPYFTRSVLALAQIRPIGGTLSNDYSTIDLIKDILEHLSSHFESSKSLSNDFSIQRFSSLLNLASVLIWKECNYNTYCLVSKDAKYHFINEFYTFVTHQLTKLNKQFYEDINAQNTDILVDQLLIIIHNALANVRTYQSLSLLTYQLLAYVSYHDTKNNEPSNVNHSSVIILTNIIEAISKFPCSMLHKMEKIDYLNAQDPRRNPLEMLSHLNFYIPSSPRMLDDDVSLNNIHHPYNVLHGIANILTLHTDGRFDSFVPLLAFDLALKCDRSPFMIEGMLSHVFTSIFTTKKAFTDKSTHYSQEKSLKLFQDVFHSFIKFVKTDESFKRRTRENDMYRMIANRFQKPYLMLFGNSDTTTLMRPKPYIITPITKDFAYQVDAKKDFSGFPTHVNMGLLLKGQPILKIDLKTSGLAQGIHEIVNGFAALSFLAFEKSSGSNLKSSPEITLAFSTMGQMLDLHKHQDVGELPSTRDYPDLSEALLIRMLSLEGRPLSLVHGKQDLIDLALQITNAETMDDGEYKNFFDISFLIHDENNIFCLANGFPVTSNVYGLIQASAYGHLSMDLFSQNYTMNLRIRLQYVGESKITVFSNAYTIGSSLSRTHSIDSIDSGRPKKESQEAMSWDIRIKIYGKLHLPFANNHGAKNLIKHTMATFMEIERSYSTSGNDLKDGKCFVLM